MDSRRPAGPVTARRDRLNEVMQNLLPEPATTLLPADTVADKDLAAAVEAGTAAAFKSVAADAPRLQRRAGRPWPRTPSPRTSR